MADNLESKVILDVEVSTQKPIKNITELKKAVEALKKQQKALKDANLENSEEYEVLGQKIKALNSAINENTKTIQNNIKEATNAEGSYNALSAQMANLKQAYHAAATEAERTSLAKQINEINDQLKEMDAAQGVFTRNVGNYQSAIVGLIPGFDQLNAVLGKVGLDVTNISGSLSKGFEQVNGSMSNLVKAVSSGSGIKAAFSAAAKAVLMFGKALLSTPIGWIAAAISALVGFLMKLKEAFNKNDEATTNLARLMDTFQPIINAVTAAFAKMAEVVGKVIGVIADFMAKLSGSIKEAQNLTTAIDNLEEAERQYAVNSAKRNRDIAELQDKAADKERYTAEERVKYLEQAGALQKKNLEDEKAIAEEHLRILIATAEREKDTTDETMNKIAQARAAVYNAEANYYKGVKEINSKIIALNVEIKKEEEDRAKAEMEAAKQRAEAAKKAKEEREKAAKEAAKIEIEIRRQAEDLVIALIKDETDKAIAARKLAGDREIEALKERLATETNLTVEARIILNQLIIDKQDALDKELEKMRKDAADKKDKEDAEREKASAMKTAQLRADAAEDGSEEEYKARKELLNLQMQQELDNAELTEEQKLLIKKKYQEELEKLDKGWADSLKANTEEALKNATDKANKAVEGIQSAVSVVGDFFNAINEAENTNLENYKEANENKQKILKSRLDSGLISQAEYEKQVTELDEEQAKKEKALQIKQAKRQKAMAIMNATLNAAAAIISSLAQSPVAIGPIPNPAGIASLALATATGAAQIAAASAVKIPTAGKGMMIKGQDHAHGGVLINAEGGEAIINKKATKRFLPLLSAMNQSTGGVPLFGKGGTIGSEKIAQSQLIDYNMLAQACAQMNVQVAVTDINRAQGNYAKVESLRTF